ALPAGRKNDPLFDMDAFRAAVAGIMAGNTPPPTLIPAIEPTPPPGAQVGRETLRRGMNGELVRVLQGKLAVSPVDGIFGADTEVAVREFQRGHSLVPDGIVGPKTWRELDAVPQGPTAHQQASLLSCDGLLFLPVLGPGGGPDRSQRRSGVIG